MATSSKARVTVVCFAPLQRDARVLRQIRALATHYDVSVVGYGSLGKDPPAGVRMHPVPEPQSFVRRNLVAVPKLVLGRLGLEQAFERWYWDRPDYRKGYELLIASRPELIYANDWDGLPVAARAARELGSRVIVDLHEYYPGQRDHRTAWRLLIKPMIEYHLRRDLPGVDGSMTVCSTIAERYHKEYGIDPVVVMNAPHLGSAPEPRPTREPIRIVHHGVAVPDRKLEVVIDAVGLLDARFELHLMLTNADGPYGKKLQAYARSHGAGRVFFSPACTPAEIVRTIAQYDVGVQVLPPVNFNHAAALSNKFFDFVCAGLAVSIGPSPEMMRLAQQYGFGVIARDFSAQGIADSLRSLTPARIDELKAASVRARSELNAEIQMAKLTKLTADVMGRPS